MDDEGAPVCRLSPKYQESPFGLRYSSRRSDIIPPPSFSYNLDWWKPARINYSVVVPPLGELRTMVDRLTGLLERARQFERYAADEQNPKLRARLQAQALAYVRLADKEAEKVRQARLMPVARKTVVR